VRPPVTALLLAAPKIISTADAAQTNKVFVFHGKIQAVDAAARSLTLQAAKWTYVFSVTDKRRIARNGITQKFSELKAGEEADVDMRIGPGGKGIAVSARRICSEQERNAEPLMRKLQTPMTAKAEAPNPRTQAPKNSQIPTTDKRRVRPISFEIWSLGFIWGLEFGFWDF